MIELLKCWTVKISSSLNRQVFVKIVVLQTIFFVVKTLVGKYVQNCINGSKLYACYIDIKKAFDIALFLKLQKADISGKIYNLIKSMYSKSRSRVKCKHVLSKSINISQGVHQGSVLSPLLFNIFINDVGDAMSEQDAPFYLTIELHICYTLMIYCYYLRHLKVCNIILIRWMNSVITGGSVLM